ncbi:MAG: zinc-ribbon domain-containing protein [Deltaproteobacteria bacterium]|uniref:Zinc-ribbon domain-containing protein n=1 Tax=Candidatus Zymogenus saltonus TaxID=2844893 RepID=A0A9D8KGB3_9DELT|nr:zinc-ribbon domain-containing protein [Candidatus Zymogenus saltonus]
MNITCPHCNLNGKISEDKLKASAGKIRCPRCKKTFSPETVVGREHEAEVVVEEIKLERDIGGDDLRFLEDDELGYVEGGGAGDISLVSELNDIGSLDEDDILGPMEGDVLEDIIDEPLEVVEPLDEDEDEEIEIRGKKGIGLKEKKPKKEPKDKVVESIPVGDKAGKVPWKRGGAEAVRWGGFRLLLLGVFLAASIYVVFYSWSAYYKPFLEEKEFLEDSKALLAKYRELKTILEEGISDPVYIVKAVELAYPYNMYVEKYDVIKKDNKKGAKDAGAEVKGNKRFNDPLYGSLAITGRLFLASKELLRRNLKPEDYFNVEWGGELPIKTREQYIDEVKAGLAACLDLMDDNVNYAITLTDISEDFSFFDRIVDHGLRIVGKNDVTKYRSFYTKNLKKVNKKKLKKFNKSIPIMKQTVEEIELFIGRLR